MRSNYAPKTASKSVVRKLKPNQVCVISYRCRDIGYGVEEDVIDGFWTGEIDTWGKYTIRPLDGPTLYLFADEFVSVEPYTSLSE